MRKQESLSAQPVGIIPTTFHFPRSLHTELKTRASLKSVSMVDVVLAGVRMALESEKYRLTEDEKRAILGA